MRLHVNLIPALAYALVMLFSNMTGITGTTGKPVLKEQAVSVLATCRELNRPENHVFVARNGQVTLSTGTGKGNLEWRIPYTPQNSCVVL